MGFAVKGLEKLLVRHKKLLNITGTTSILNNGSNSAITFQLIGATSKTMDATICIPLVI